MHAHRHSILNYVCCPRPFSDRDIHYDSTVTRPNYTAVESLFPARWVCMYMDTDMVCVFVFGCSLWMTLRPLVRSAITQTRAKLTGIHTYSCSKYCSYTHTHTHTGALCLNPIMLFSWLPVIHIVCLSCPNNRLLAIFEALHGIYKGLLSWTAWYLWAV